MREIKFRAWDKNFNEMADVLSIDFNTEDAYIKWKDGLQETRDFSEVELMQFTELYDKNGKEIYEGDIVDDSETELIYVIEFICGEFVGINEECGIGRIMNSLSEDGEVIGNIHDQ